MKRYLINSQKKYLAFALALFYLVIFFSNGCESKPKESWAEREIRLLADSTTLAAAKFEKRKNFWYEGRNVFLDLGLDVEVNVRGTEFDTLILMCALFSDVWARKFETHGTYTVWKDLGFKCVKLKDGYKYNRSVTLDYY